MSINLKAPEKIILKPEITIIGVGGGGNNAVNNMINAQLQGATYVVCNTDAQALDHSIADNKIQLGVHTTRGLGAGASPEVGMAAAEESAEEIMSYLQNSNMVFITAGMGGGTGTGGAPVVAKLAKEMGILTVGVVTKPFHFEGMHRMKAAEKGILELQKYVDTLIVIPNQNLFRIANERTTFADAFKMADDVLHHGVRSITDLMIMPGLINLDFADVRSVMSEMGKAMMGTGEASGDNRAIEAAERAISNPLLEQHSIRGAKNLIINITGGPDMTLFEVDTAANRIRQEVEGEASIIFGSTFNPALEGIMRVSVVATGIDAEAVMSIRASHVVETLEEINQPEEALLEEAVTEDAMEAEAEFEEEQAVFAEKREEAEGTSLPPRYGEYNMAESASQAPTPQEESGPLALLRKMWGFTKPSAQQQPQMQYKQAPVHEGHPSQTAHQNSENQSGEVYDIPAFLRRRK